MGAAIARRASKKIPALEKLKVNMFGCDCKDHV